MPDLINPEAATLWRDSLDSADRVLVIGASGWFGKTTVALLADTQIDRMLIASRAREITVGAETASCVKWNVDAIRDFAPTVIIDCAFLTRDLISGMTLDDYIERNSNLTRNMLAAASIDSVKKVLTISSGAAVFPDDALNHPIEENPYGWLKRQAERALDDLALERGICAVVARAWSVSGALVAKPLSYALSDMIMQAVEGEIHIKASRLVYRRYVSVEDLLAVSLASAANGVSLTIDSGGTLVEMQTLAEEVSRVVNPFAKITRGSLSDLQPDNYFSNDQSWLDACRAQEFTAEDLPAQIERVHSAIL